MNGKNRAMRRQSMGVFRRHATLNASNDKFEDRRRWLPQWKAALIEIKPIIQKGK